jgi:type IV secretory pathway VirD2 relaxase
MDYVVANYPLKYIRNLFNLTQEQIEDVMDYIESHREEFEAEYQLVVQKDEELRQYYEAKTQKLRDKIASMPPKPGQEKIRAKLQAWKEELGVA